MSDESAAIRNVWQQYTDAVNGGDIAKYGATLTNDIVFHAPDQPPINGMASVQKWFKESWLDTTTSRKLSFKLEEIETLGAWAFARGQFTVTVTWKTGGKQDISGNFLNVFRRQSDSSWKFARVSFNFDKPFVPSQ